MHAGLIEAVPGRPVAALAIAGEEGGAVVADDVVLAGGNVQRAGPEGLEEAVGDLELLGLREVRHVAGMDDERRRRRHAVDLGDRLAESGGDVGIGLLGEADVAVADLHEVEAAGIGLLRRILQRVRPRHAADQGPGEAGARPCHAFQNRPPAYPVNHRPLHCSGCRN